MLSIKARQVAGVTSLVGAVVVAVSALHLSSLARISLQETASRGEMLARAIYQRAREVVPNAADPYAALRQDPGLRSLLQSAAAYSKNVTYAAIVDTGGMAVAHSFPELEGQALAPQGDLDTLQKAGAVAQFQAIYSDSTFELRQPLVWGDDKAFGAIRIGVSPLLVRSELQQALRRAAGTALTALIIASLVSMLLAQWMLRPIHIIRSGLTRLGQGELDVHLDLPPGDEFRELGTSFEVLTRRLASDSLLAPPGYSQKLVALGRLLTGLAHEVKNPLNAMMIHLELLRNKLDKMARASRPAPVLVGPATAASGPSDPEIEALKHAQVIADEIRRLDQVLQGFLKFARPGELKLQPVAVDALLEDVARVVQPQAEAARVELRVESAAGLPPVDGDSTMLEQALMNLALNACQAMPDGGTLRLTGRPGRRGRVEIAVQDTGVGIAPDHLGKVFDLYFTTKDHGSGIGLSMVYRIVQLHDGDIEVESTPGRGTTFRLSLPVAKSVETAERAEAAGE
jgi:signal transduction histidine kinase